ncbi:hypothetical protein GUJ93_ZPchr0003g17699 [Zizania palustris]|uniref:Uncharacterized protein n=1 Tax=Zizania palustris TaxID=103762 RepID=A0A8J5SFM3_ZIZPA|nr:hypothetical protein GUJ93_ZPchr0003g17699 [Zizania palustris]
MDIPLYQQLQLSPPSPKPADHHQSFIYYSPSFATGAGCCPGEAGVSKIGSPEEALMMQMHPFMEEEPPPAPKAAVEAEYDADAAINAQGVESIGGLEREAAAAARKDRHSKICTAGGMRDRRMRLSLDVARKSKTAIREIMSDDASSGCEEDGSSSLSVDGKHNNTADAGGGEHKGGAQNHSDGKKPARARRAATTPKPPRRLANAHPVQDKESRAKARERARERTREKNRMRWVTLASAISVEAATAAAVAAASREDDMSPTSPNNLNHSSSTNLAAVSAELEEGYSSTLHTGVSGRMQEISVASEPSDDVIMAFANGGAYGDSNYYLQLQLQQQEQWELGGVVFANSRHQY